MQCRRLPRKRKTPHVDRDGRQVLKQCISILDAGAGRIIAVLQVKIGSNDLSGTFNKYAAFFFTHRPTPAALMMSVSS